MRFLVDNSLSWRLAEWLRSTAHDALHVRDIGLGDASDEEIYLRARGESRIIVTQDVDFGYLLARGADPGATVILFRMSDGRVQTQQKRLEELIAQFSHELLPRTIIVLTDAVTRIRRF